MKAVVGIIKEVDKLGRILIPKELRERFGLTDFIEIIATEDGVMIRNPEYRLVKVEKNDKNNSKKLYGKNAR